MVPRQRKEGQTGGDGSHRASRSAHAKKVVQDNAKKGSGCPLWALVLVAIPATIAAAAGGLIFQWLA